MKLQCVCGKVLNVPESMTGERVRCKECGKVLTVRAPSHGDSTASGLRDPNDPLTVRNQRLCPSCKRSWPARDRICTACGVDMETGATLYTSLDASGESARATAAARPGIVGRLLRLIGRRGD